MTLKKQPLHSLPEKGLLLPEFSIDTVLDLLRWSVHSPHPLQNIVPRYPFNNRDSLFEPNMVSYQPQTPKVKQEGDKKQWRLSQADSTSSKQHCVWKAIQQEIAYISEQCKRGCMKRNRRLELHTPGQTLCIIVLASGPKDARGRHVSEQLQVWNFNCETGNSFWRSWLRNMGQT